MQNAAVFRRVMWKEYRVLRAFWIAVALIVLATQCIAWLSLSGTELQRAFHGIVSVFIVLYALAAAAILFAVEREEGTDGFLQVMPVPSGRLFIAKLTLAMASTIALAVMLYLLIEAWRAFGLIGPQQRFSIWDEGRPHGALAFTAIACDVFVCGLLCSLLLKRALVAACVGAGLAMIVLYLGTLIVSVLEGPQYGTSADDFGRLWSLTIFGLSACVFAIDLWLGQRWLDIDAIRGALRRKRRAAPIKAAAPKIKRVVNGPTLRAAFGRLIWQEFRQAWRMMAIFLCIGTALAAWAAIPGGDPDTCAQLAALFTAGIVAIMGATTFYTDQERSQYRYFAERPVRPRMVWLNRLLVWWSVIFLYLMVATPIWVAMVFRHVIQLIQPLEISDASGRPIAISFTGAALELPGSFAFIFVIFLAYACGQLCSMLFRSGVIAAFAAIILAATLLGWSAFMGDLHVNWLISTAPLPFILLAVTWLRAPHWIADRGGWWPWTRLALSLAVPLAAVGIATASFRVLQIPKVDPGFSPAQYAAEITPAARETAQMYIRAATLIDNQSWPRGKHVWAGRADYIAASIAGLLPGSTNPPSNAEARREWLAQREIPQAQNMLPWLAANREALDVALEATRRPSCAFTPDEFSNPHLSYLEILIGTEAYRLGQEGDLAGMLDCEMATLRMSVHFRQHQIGDRGWFERQTLDVLKYYWPTLPGQSADLLRRAIHEIDDWQKIVPDLGQSAKAAYLRDERLLSNAPDALSEFAQSNPYFSVKLPRYVFIQAVMPWETARARRVLNFLTAQDLQAVQPIEAALAQHEPTSRLAQQAGAFSSQPLVQTTPLLSMISGFHWTGNAETWLNAQMQRDVTQVVLALEAYRLEHGVLPATLDELTGPYVSKLPRDPYSGDSFRYFPHGIPHRLTNNRSGDGPIPADTPFLWSCGALLLPVVPGLEGDNDRYLHLGWNGVAYRDAAPFADVIEAGLATPIPHRTPVNEPADDAPAAKPPPAAEAPAAGYQPAGAEPPSVAPPEPESDPFAEPE